MSYEYGEVLDRVVARSREWVEFEGGLTDDEAADVILLCDLAEDMKNRLGAADVITLRTNLEVEEQGGWYPPGQYLIIPLRAETRHRE